jgi:error-prone DNA polymerase
VRDAGAALGMAPAEIGAIAKSFPHIRARDARTALAELPELRRSAMAGDGRLDVLFDLVESLDALPRHVALHPCGIVLSNATLLDRTPVEDSALGFPMSQFDKDDVEHMGLLKLDVLGIRMQSAMAHAVDEVVRVGGAPIDLDDRQQVPLDDPKTFALIRSTRTLGCFQIESPGQRELLGRFAPEEFADLVIDISLFRPGPVKSDMITPFLRARQGWSQPQYLHPDLEPALRQTQGVVVFHEQVLQVVAVFTGCSLAYADEVRRALGDRDRHEELRAWFYPAAFARGYRLEVVEKVWDVLVAFGSFGFCKAHAAAFALPTYQSAWLKQHHPAAFLAGVLTHDPGMYPKRLILDDARHFGVEVLGLDINRSDAVYRVEPVEHADSGFGIRMALAEVKGINDDEVARIVAGRPYADLADFWWRARVSRPVAERLLLAGAFDTVAGIGNGRGGVQRRRRTTRRDLLLQMADLDRLTRSTSARRSTTGQLALAMPDLVGSSQGLPEMTDTERVRAELEVLGMDVSRHVVDFYAPLLEALGVTRSVDLLGKRSKAELLVAGVKVATQTPPVRSGRRVVFLTLDDSTGPVDLAFFDDVQGEATNEVFGGWLLLARGEVRRTGPRGISLRATGAWDLTALQRLADTEGIQAVLQRISDTPRPGENSSFEEESRPRRVLLHPSGYRQSPYADLKPQGVEVSDTRRSLPPRQLWHTSPGSPGAGA